MHGPLTRYVKSRVAHGPWMPGTFFPPPTSKETTSQRSRHASRHARHACVLMHVGICLPAVAGKIPAIPRACATRKFYVTGKMPITVMYQKQDGVPCQLDVVFKSLFWQRKKSQFRFVTHYPSGMTDKLEIPNDVMYWDILLYHKLCALIDAIASAMKKVFVIYHGKSSSFI